LLIKRFLEMDYSEIKIDDERDTLIKFDKFE
jgi:hypothetical protein